MRRQRRRRSKKARATPDVRPSRFIRLRLPDGGLGRTVPVVFYPRYSTVVGASAPGIFEVSRYPLAALRKTGRGTLRLVVSEENDLRWDGVVPPKQQGSDGCAPLKSDRHFARRSSRGRKVRSPEKRAR